MKTVRWGTEAESGLRAFFPAGDVAEQVVASGGQSRRVSRHLGSEGWVKVSQ